MSTHQLETQILFNEFYKQLLTNPVLLYGKRLRISSGWVLVFDDHKSSAGRCHFSKMTISISTHYVNSSKTTIGDIADTLLHELAHAIAGPAAGHGPIWRDVAKAIGCSTNVYAKRFIFHKDYKYVIKCPKGCVRHRHRLSLKKHRLCPIHNEQQKIIKQK
jgi:SprT protein